jgi:hypothetical protein
VGVSSKARKKGKTKMTEFSRLYKIMAATAEEIQRGRFLIRGDDRVEVYQRDRYAEQEVFNLVSIKGLSEEEKTKQVEEYVWIPSYVDLRDVFFGDRRIRDSEKYAAQEFVSWQDRNADLLKKVSKELPSDDREHALALLYVMEGTRIKEKWDWEGDQGWVKIERG